MECTCEQENDPSLSLTALVVVLGLVFSLCFALRIALPDLPLYVHDALAELPGAGEQAHLLHSERIATAEAMSHISRSATSGVQR
jgi:hypothetical protein